MLAAPIRWISAADVVAADDAVGALCAGGVSKSIVLRRECAIVFRLIRGFSIFFFSSLDAFDFAVVVAVSGGDGGGGGGVDVTTPFTAPTSLRFRFWFTVFFVSVFCGVFMAIGLCSGNNDGGANNFRFNGFNGMAFASGAPHSFGSVAAADGVAAGGVATNLSN